MGRINKGVKGYVAEVQNDGLSLVYSTFFPGSANDNGFSIAVDSSGNAWIAGLAYQSGPAFFPVTADAADARQRAQAGLLVEFDKTGSSLLYGSYTGGTAGSSADIAFFLALGANGQVFVTAAPRAPILQPRPQFSEARLPTTLLTSSVLI